MKKDKDLSFIEMIEADPTFLTKKHKDAEYKADWIDSDGCEVSGSFDSRNEYYRYQMWHDGALLFTHAAKTVQTAEQCSFALNKFFSREE